MSIDKIPPLDAAALLKRHGLRAHKSLGQNFLQDPQALEEIIMAAEIQPGDTVLEIGPGLGSLTRYLAVVSKEVVAVELDENLLAPLKAVLSPYQNVRIVHGDILKLPLKELISADEYIVVANIPYYITSAVIRHLLENELKPRRVVLTVQKEVAQRICARPGDMSLLALSVQIYGEPRIVTYIPAGAFFPPPKVDSAVLAVEIYPAPLIAADTLDTFFKLIKAGFGQKRKTLRNSLSSGLHISPAQASDLLTRAEIDPQRRAETLSIREWELLSSIYAT
ncbi:MAG TPA: 16S rRNA (adenine(1518)-N(6)/adenine(1519)-N(6))-dimethyltransferase RsmA [Anaerolineales bacterium]|nr:16S rRNA (adenine(1518)-N(6)/adenine(1519)-N(6))-dimethyltransferase RsmA [Anaerolineales bacterium]